MEGHIQIVGTHIKKNVFEWFGYLKRGSSHDWLTFGPLQSLGNSRHLKRKTSFAENISLISWVNAFSHIRYAVDELRPQRDSMNAGKDKLLRIKMPGLSVSGLIFLNNQTIHPLSLNTPLNSAMLVLLKAPNARYRNSCGEN